LEHQAFVLLVDQVEPTERLPGIPGNVAGRGCRPFLFVRLHLQSTGLSLGVGRHHLHIFEVREHGP
jgi:hypothetical protein